MYLIHNDILSIFVLPLQSNMGAFLFPFNRITYFIYHWSTCMVSHLTNWVLNSYTNSFQIQNRTYVFPGWDRLGMEIPKWRKGVFSVPWKLLALYVTLIWWNCAGKRRHWCIYTHVHVLILITCPSFFRLNLFFILKNRYRELSMIFLSSFCHYIKIRYISPQIINL